jgi:serine/threonine protein kinase
MSATFIDSVLRNNGSQQPQPRTVDLDLTGTTDVHEENTADLVDGAAPRAAPPEPLARPEARTPAAETARTMNKAPSLPLKPTIAPGTILCDRYILERLIGQGGTAVVYRARDIRHADSGGGSAEASIAIKIPMPGAKSRERAAARLKHEFERAKALVHPSIVRVFELQQVEQTDDGAWFMTMELIDGKLLSTLLKERSATPVSLAYKILRACAQALSYAHEQQIIHGDFKPSNVFVTPDAGVKVVDFGAAAASPDDPSRIPAATPAYASPEVVSGQTPEQRDDVFSFACVAYELLTGAHPFDRKSSVEARDAGWVPQRAWALSTSQWLTLLSALSWQREQRPESIDAFIAKLTDEFSDVIVPDSDALHEPQSDLQASELPSEFMPRNRGWGFVAFAAAALALVFIGVRRPDDRPATAPPVASGPQSVVGMAAALPSTLTSSVIAEPQLAAPSSTPQPKAKDEPEAATQAEPAHAAPVAVSKPRTAGSNLGEVSFDSDSVVTSESSIAAVFVVKRKAPLRGRAVVNWKARGVSAEADSDFLADSGTVEFADGQTTRAIYVPLRDDQLKEGDETFTVVLESPEGVRLGASPQAVATIRDDD